MATGASGVCNCVIYIEELTAAAHMVLHGNCMNCFHPVNQHQRRPTRLPQVSPELVLADLNDNIKLFREDLRRLEEGVQQNKAAVDVLGEGLRQNEIRRMKKTLNCWRTNNRTQVESSEFKRAVINYYQRAGNVNSSGDIVTARCMIADAVFNYDELTPAHLVKHCTPELMVCYGLPPSEIDSPRNGILILKKIEESFDRLDVCFLYDGFLQKLRLKVLRPELLNQRISPSSATELRTFRDIDGAELMQPNPDTRPYRRILSMHAKYAFARALSFHWIDNTELIDTYFSASDDGLQEPGCINTLSWAEMNYEEIEAFV